MSSIPIWLNSNEEVSQEFAERIAAIFEAIIREREFQNNKYGPIAMVEYQCCQDKVQNPERAGHPGEIDATCMNCECQKVYLKPVKMQGRGGHELGAWLLVIEKELQEAKDAAVHGGFQKAKGRDSIRSELIQIAAVAIAALEQHGIREDPETPMTAAEITALKQYPKWADK